MQTDVKKAEPTPRTHLHETNTHGATRKMSGMTSYLLPEGSRTNRPNSNSTQRRTRKPLVLKRPQPPPFKNTIFRIHTCMGIQAPKTENQGGAGVTERSAYRNNGLPVVDKAPRQRRRERAHKSQRASDSGNSVWTHSEGRFFCNPSTSWCLSRQEPLFSLLGVVCGLLI